MDTIDEQTLIAQLIEGEEQAFRYAIKSYQNAMLYVARSIVGTSIADEVVQDAWISIIKALPKFEGRSSLKTWILRIVSNNAKSRLRKENRHVSIGDANDLETLGAVESRYQENGMWAMPPNQWNNASPEAILSSDELKGIIYASIGTLPQIQQTIICLRDMEGLAMDEICKILEISESNSRVLLHRARAKVWQAIDKHEGKSNVKL